MNFFILENSPVIYLTGLFFYGYIPCNQAMANQDLVMHAKINHGGMATQHCLIVSRVSTASGVNRFAI